MTINRNVTVVAGPHQGQISFPTAIVSPRLMKFMEVSQGVINHGGDIISCLPLPAGDCTAAKVDPTHKPIKIGTRTFIADENPNPQL